MENIDSYLWFNFDKGQILKLGKNIFHQFFQKDINYHFSNDEYIVASYKWEQFLLSNILQQMILQLGAGFCPTTTKAWIGSRVILLLTMRHFVT